MNSLLTPVASFCGICAHADSAQALQPVNIPAPRRTINTRQATLTASIGPDGNLTLPYPYEVASNSSEEAADGAEVTAAAASAAASAPSFTAQALAPLQDEREYVVVEYREPTKRRMFRLQNNGNTTAAAAAVTEAAAVVNADVTVSQASPVVQDVLIVYTAAAARQARGKSAIKAAARDTGARPNKAYADTGLNLRQRLVDVRAVSCGHPMCDTVCVICNAFKLCMHQCRTNRAYADTGLNLRQRLVDVSSVSSG